MKYIITITIFLLSYGVFAFTLVGPGVKHSDFKITINVSNNDCDQSGYSATQILDMVEETVDIFWNTASTSAIELTRGGITTDDLGTATFLAVRDAAESNTILLACSDGTDYGGSNPFTSGWVGGFGGMIVSGGVSKGGLILNNLTAGKLSGMTKNERLALIAHEIGHAIGLHHSADPVALMYYTLNGKDQQKLTQDDVDGVTYLYPNEKELGGLAGSCGTIAPIGGGGNGGGPGSMLLTICLGAMLAILFSKIPLIFKRKLLSRTL